MQREMERKKEKGERESKGKGGRGNERGRKERKGERKRAHHSIRATGARTQTADIHGSQVSQDFSYLRLSLRNATVMTCTRTRES